MPYGKGSRPPRRESYPPAALGFAFIYAVAFLLAVVALIILL